MKNRILRLPVVMTTGVIDDAIGDFGSGADMLLL